jgi:L-ascorbate metabolism protein UlaG (beta-lactamase superfamily)
MGSTVRFLGILVIGLTICLPAALLLATPATAQIETSTCLAVAGDPPRIWRAQLRAPALAADEVRITYVGHSAFRLETPAGISIVTDFAGYYGDGGAPVVATMNHAHSSHYTDFPDPAIKYVLRGWNPGGGPADHKLQLEDVYIRNVPTDLYFEGAMIEENGNSIFIFEVAGLCIGHLGHLHHRLRPEHIAKIGRLDILFMAVDGTYTMSQAGMIELAQQLRSSIVIPMHFFSTYSLQRFLSGMQPDFSVSIKESNEIVVSLRSLPQSPEVAVLLPR